MAWPTFDPAKHSRDRLGRFAGKGVGNGERRQQFRIGSVSRIRTTRYEQLQRKGQAAVPGRVQEAPMRERVTRKKAQIQEAVSSVPWGESRAQQRFARLHYAPHGMARMSRVASTRTGKGKAVVVRDYASYQDPERGTKIIRFRKAHLRNFAGTKTAAPKRQVQVRQVGYKPRHAAG